MQLPHASSDELLAFALDGEPLCLASQEHLSNCSACQHQVSSYKRSVIHLHPALYRSHCPSSALLSFYCLPGALPEGERLQIAEHIVRCPLCTRELGEARAFLQIS